jgi:hypothetical protein
MNQAEKFQDEIAKLRIERRQAFLALQNIDLKLETLEYRQADYLELLNRIENLKADYEGDAIERSPSLYALAGDLKKMKSGDTKNDLIYRLYSKLQENIEALYYLGYVFESELIPTLIRFDKAPAKVWSQVGLFERKNFNKIPANERQNVAFLTELLSYSPFVYDFFPIEAKLDKNLCLSYLKACQESEIEIADFGLKKFVHVAPLLIEKEFAYQAVSRYPLISYALPAQLSEDAEFMYELFQVKPDSAKPFYFKIKESDKTLDTEKAGAELKAKAEAQRLERDSPRSKSSTKKRFKI